ncbi:uncharacterized protein LOC143300775 [Babylonia areolata]|uniref:uncharacterized protein LOC143300775 n=1 Tax=Babylonia areolata TaxID=304850 RepID=UPI003FD405E6
MVVFYKHGLKERINACLFTLSLVDLMCVSVAFVYSSDVTYMFVIGKGGELGLSAQFLMRNFLTGLAGMMSASQMVYCVITLERCLCITRPLLVKSFMSTRTTVVVLWTMVLFITGFTLFMAGIQYRALCVFDPTHDSVSYINYPTHFYFRHKLILDSIYSSLMGLFIPAFSFICVTVCTVVTATELKKLTQWRESSSSAPTAVTSRDIAITRIVIGTSVLFLVCMVPSILMRFSFLLIPDLALGGRYDNLAWVIRRFYQLSVVINSTFNFFVYYNYGSKFRETTHQLFSYCCQRVGVEDKQADTEVMHRTGRRSGDKNRPILVRFFDRKKRDQVLFNRHRLMGKGTSAGEDLKAAN